MGRFCFGASCLWASCPVTSSRSELLDDRDMRKHLFCDCASGTGSNQDHEDGCKWIAIGTKEIKHIGKIRTTHTYIVK